MVIKALIDAAQSYGRRILAAVLSLGVLAGVLGAAALAEPAPVNWVIDSNGNWNDISLWGNNSALSSPGNDATVDRPKDIAVGDLTGAAAAQSLALKENLAVAGGLVQTANGAMVGDGQTSDGMGVMAICQIAGFLRGTFTATGGNYQFTGLTNIDGSSFAVSNGAKVVAPVVNHFDDTAISSAMSRSLTADGSGSILDLHSLPVIGATSAGSTTLTVKASSGGKVDLSGVKTLSTGPVQITADGLDSIIDFSDLTTFLARGPLGSSSAVKALNGGKILFGASPPPMPGLNLTVANGGSVAAGEYQLTLGAVLSGDGAFKGNLTNLATVRPGSSTGTLAINGDYTQESNGTLLAEIGGTEPGQFDAIAVSGSASLDGTLKVDLTDNFAPAAGQSYQILTASGGVKGRFATTSLPPLGAGKSWGTTYGSDSVTLFVVPEPGSVALIGSGLVALLAAAGWRRRRARQ